MSFADFQATVNEGWRQKRVPVRPVRMRKKNLCIECGKQGYAVKMEYKGNKHITGLYTRYDVSVYQCPRCGRQDKRHMRIEGRGTCGTNSGKMLGGG